MKTSRFSDPQIVAILKQAEDGVLLSQLCHEHGMNSASFYKWRHLIENYFGSLKENRDIAMRSCKADMSFKALVSLAATVIRLT